MVWDYAQTVSSKRYDEVVDNPYKMPVPSGSAGADELRGEPATPQG